MHNDSLLPAAVEDDHKRAFEDDFQVEPYAAAVYVLDIQTHPFVERQRVSVLLYLPQAKQPALDVETVFLVFVVLLDFHGNGRTGTYHAHAAI